MVSEENMAGSGYIINFFNDIENLTNSYAGYLNVLVRIQDRYNLKEQDNEKRKTPLKNLESEDEQALLEVAETLRVWIARCYIKATTLQERIPTMKTGVANLKQLYEKAISKSVIEKEVVENFVLAINKMFVAGILKDLLMRSQDIYAEILKGSES